MVHHLLGGGGGDGEAKTFNGLLLVHHLHIGDPHHLPGGVDQGAPGIARVQGGGGLDQAHIGAVIHPDRTVDGRDNAVCHGAPQLFAQGVADGVGRLTHLKPGGIPEPGGGESPGGDLQHGKVGLPIIAHQESFPLAVIGEHYLQGAAPCDHMGVGDDVPLLRHNDAAAQSHPPVQPGPDTHDSGAYLPVDLLGGEGLAARGLKSEDGAVAHGGAGGGGVLQLLQPVVLLLPRQVPAAGQAPLSAKGAEIPR